MTDAPIIAAAGRVAQARQRMQMAKTPEEWGKAHDELLEAADVLSLLFPNVTPLRPLNAETLLGDRPLGRVEGDHS